MDVPVERARERENSIENVTYADTVKDKIDTKHYGYCRRQVENHINIETMTGCGLQRGGSRETGVGSFMHILTTLGRRGLA